MHPTSSVLWKESRCCPKAFNCEQGNPRAVLMYNMHTHDLTIWMESQWEAVVNTQEWQAALTISKWLIPCVERRGAREFSPIQPLLRCWDYVCLYVLFNVNLMHFYSNNNAKTNKHHTRQINLCFGTVEGVAVSNVISTNAVESWR